MPVYPSGDTGGLGSVSTMGVVSETIGEARFGERGQKTPEEDVEA